MQLELIFGSGSVGEAPEARARTSKRTYVRSQVQLAEWSPAARGRRITATEALDLYGLDALRAVAEHGYAPLVGSKSEPAYTLRRRREALGLTPHAVANAAGVKDDIIHRAETSGAISRIGDLENIAQALALDERVIGYKANAGGDTELGVRLRERDWSRDVSSFSAKMVTDLSEAAWVIARQSELGRKIQASVSTSTTSKLRSADYSFPTWRRGYELASRARSEFGLGEAAPIESLRRFIEGTLGLPLVQMAMHPSLAGATLANGDARGVVINEVGNNSNVWVRRMTLAHEVGHLLGDPDEFLNKLRVDDYDRLNRPAQERDLVEMRANGFAIAFLAPPEAVRRIADSSTSVAEAINEVTNRFGISRTAALYHLKNVADLDTSGVRSMDIIDNSNDWVAPENMTIDWFPINSTPISRRGNFAKLVYDAYVDNYITDDTAASWLKCTPPAFRAAAPSFGQIFFH